MYALGDRKAKITLQREGAPNPEIKIKLPPPKLNKASLFSFFPLGKYPNQIKPNHLSPVCVVPYGQRENGK